MRRHIRIAGILALLVASPALAQQASPQDSQQDLEGGLGGHVADRAFGDVDRDGDGTISKSELREAYGGEGSSERAFSEMDRNADGVLSEQEYMLPGNTGEVVDPGENPYEALNPGESGARPLPDLTRDQDLMRGVSLMDNAKGEMVPQSEQRTERSGANETGKGIRPYGTQEERGPEDHELNGEMGGQEGRGPAEVPTPETYGNRDYDTTPEYDMPPVGTQGGSGITDPQGPDRSPREPLS